MSTAERLFIWVLIVVTVAAIGFAWYGQWDARKQPLHKFGPADRPEEGWQR